MELNEHKFPVICSGCAENCYSCEKRFRGTLVSEIRTLAAKRIMKEKAKCKLCGRETVFDVLSMSRLPHRFVKK